MTGSRQQAKASLNLILLGTGEHHAQVETVLTLLSKAIEKTPTQHVHVIDGPGANAPGDGKHPMLGTYHFKCLLDPESEDVVPDKILKTGFFETPSILSGLIAGAGCQDAIAEAVEYVDAIMTAGKKPLVINMFGYSRGSDTAIRLSNVLQTLYPREEMEINIFGIDPVPGPKRHSSVRSRLVDVNDYEVVFMCHETRPFLALQDLTQLEVKNPDALRIHLFSGDHGASKRFRYLPSLPELAREANSNTMDTPRLLWHNLHAFAKRHGITFKNDEQIPFVAFDDGAFAWSASGKCRVIPQTETALAEEERERVRLKLYTQMQKKEQYYRSFASPLGVPRAFINRKRDYFLHGAHFFQDKAHMELFQKYYPAFFDYFFQKNREGKTPVAVIADITTMCAQDPDLVQQLTKKGYGALTTYTAENLPAPRGIPVIMTAMYANHELMRLYWGLQSACLAVIGDQDTSMSKENAEMILQKARRIISDDVIDVEKIRRLQVLTASVILHHEYDGLFAYKLIALVDSRQVVEVKARDLVLSYMKDPHMMSQPALAKAIKSCWIELEIATAASAKKTVIRKVAECIQSLQHQVSLLPQSYATQKIQEQTAALLTMKMPRIETVDRIVQDLERYLNRFEWLGFFRNQALVTRKKQIAQQVKHALQNLKTWDAGDDIVSIKEILNLAALATGQLVREHEHLEGRLNRIFRSALMHLPCPSTNRIAIKEEVINSITQLRMQLSVGSNISRSGIFARTNASQRCHVLASSASPKRKLP